MSKTLNIQAEDVFKQVVDEIVDEKYNATTTEVARELIRLGLDVKKAGEGLEIKGPGGPRPFAKIDFGDEKHSIATSIPEEVAEEIQRTFAENGEEIALHPAARQALRLGVATVKSDELTIQGPLGFPRPFAYLEPPKESDLNDEGARERLRWLRRSGETQRSSVVLEGEVKENGTIEVEDLDETSFETGDSVRMLVTEHENE